MTPAEVNVGRTLGILKGRQQSLPIRRDFMNLIFHGKELKYRQNSDDARVRYADL